ncbi:MAG: DUF2612 domain-containing protein [Oscillospiraceae bacterium]|jgi:hypothetical protein|nr:DUF2612 domain-containing protein [Oscillospiraceae bacterium]
MDYKPYLDLITPQHRVRPKYAQWVSFLLSLLDMDTSARVGVMFDPRAATGKTLDAIGELVGIDRRFPALSPIPGCDRDMTDDVYRKMILAKIVTNNYNGKQGDLLDLWETVFGRDLIAATHDNQDMLMDIELAGDFSPIDTQLVLDGYIVPKPVGVGMRVALAAEIDTPWLGAASSINNDAMIELTLENTTAAVPPRALNAATAPPVNDASVEFFYRYDASVVPPATLFIGALPSANTAAVEIFLPVPDLLNVSAARAGLASTFGAASAVIEVFTTDTAVNAT